MLLKSSLFVFRPIWFDCSWWLEQRGCTEFSSFRFVRIAFRMIRLQILSYRNSIGPSSCKQTPEMWESTYSKPPNRAVWSTTPQVWQAYFETRNLMSYDLPIIAKLAWWAWKKCIRTCTDIRFGAKFKNQWYKANQTAVGMNSSLDSILLFRFQPRQWKLRQNRQKIVPPISHMIMKMKLPNQQIYWVIDLLPWQDWPAPWLLRMRSLSSEKSTPNWSNSL